MDLRVWWIRNLPGAAKNYPVETTDEAMSLLDALALVDLHDPDVESNAGGLEVMEGGEWLEWEDDQGRDIEEVHEAATV